MVEAPRFVPKEILETSLDWIVQQVCLGSQPIIICGVDQVSWKYVTQLREARIHLSPSTLSEGERFFMKSFLVRLDQQREARRKDGCLLWIVLEAFIGSECQIVHDKVYGFLAVSNDCASRGIPIDYSK
jgi:hypothetical protein